MRVIEITVKTDEAAQSLKDFLQTIDYVEIVNENTIEDLPTLIKGEYRFSEKPSDFEGIWKNRKKLDANNIRQRAWKIKKSQVKIYWKADLKAYF